MEQNGEGNTGNTGGRNGINIVLTSATLKE